MVRKIFKMGLNIAFIFFISDLYAANVFITGGNRGIGLALVKEYVKKGDTVYTTYRDADTSKELLDLAEENLIKIKVDFLEEDAIKKINAALDHAPLDILIHNAGIFPYKVDRAPNLDNQEWVEAFKINAIFPIQLTLALKDNLLRSGSAKVIFVSSRRGSNTVNIADCYEGRYGYRSSKAALNSSVVALAQDFEKDNITVVMVHPGRVATQMTSFKGTPATESAKSIKSVAQSLTFKETGKFINVEDKKVLPW